MLELEAQKEQYQEEWESGTEKIGQQLSNALQENKTLKEQKHKKIPAGFVLIEKKSYDKVARDLMEVSEQRKKLEEENKQLKRLKNVHEGNVGYWRQQLAERDEHKARYLRLKMPCTTVLQYGVHTGPGEGR